MINHLKLESFGPLPNIEWENLGKINLVIGGNGSGKTFLLKAIYSSLRTLEDYKRGNEQRSAAEILADKLYWTFQAEKIGDLVRKGAESPLSNCIKFDGNEFSYSFGKDTSKQIQNLVNQVPPRSSNSVFLPAKEVLSLYHIILSSREHDKTFGFDDTYYDLAKALRASASRNKRKLSVEGLEPIAKLLGGNFEYDAQKTSIAFKKDKEKISPISDEARQKIIIDINDRIKELLLELTKNSTPRISDPSKENPFEESRKQLENILGGRIEYETSANSWFFSKDRYKYPIGVTAEGIKKIAILDTLLGNGYLDTNSVVIIDEPESALHPTAISQLFDIISTLAGFGIQFFMASHSYFVVKKLFLIAQKNNWSIPVISASDSGWICDDLKNGMPENPIIAESIRLYQQEVELSFK